MCLHVPGHMVGLHRVAAERNVLGSICQNNALPGRIATGQRQHCLPTMPHQCTLAQLHWTLLSGKHLHAACIWDGTCIDKMQEGPLLGKPYQISRVSEKVTSREVGEVSCCCMLTSMTPKQCSMTCLSKRTCNITGRTQSKACTLASAVQEFGKGLLCLHWQCSSSSVLLTFLSLTVELTRLQPVIIQLFGSRWGSSWQTAVSMILDQAADTLAKMGFMPNCSHHVVQPLGTYRDRYFALKPACLIQQFTEI